MSSASMLLFTALLLLCLLPSSTSTSPIFSHLSAINQLAAFLPASTPTTPTSPILPDYSHLLDRHDSLGRHYRARRELGLLPDVPSAPAPAQYFTQRLDHFDRSNLETWPQKYYVNDSLWDGHGPVFLLYGWEGPMQASYVAGPWAVNSLAEQFHGLIVCLEHRFYGDSVPNGNHDIGRLRFLSSEQSLEDTADWVAHINAQYKVPAHTPWIVTGGSYSGFLAAAARAKYPHLYAGAIAVSGPVEAQVDYQGYNEVVAVALGPTCAAALKAGNDKVTALLSTTAGQAQLAEDFHLCAPLSDPLEQAIFVSTWSYDIGGTVQYARNGTVATWCEKYMAAGNGDPYLGLAELYFPKRTACRGGFSYAAFVNDSKRPGDGRSWGWQTCTEVGYFQDGAGTQRNPMSSKLTVELSLRWCNDTYGIPPSAVYENINATNANYGGFDIYASNVVYSNGALDPWHVSAVYPPNKGGVDNVVFLIANASHCTDFDAPTEKDSLSLRDVRALQIDAIKRWVA